MKWIYILYVFTNVVMDSYFGCDKQTYANLAKKPFRLQRSTTSEIYLNSTNNITSTKICKIKN